MPLNLKIELVKLIIFGIIFVSLGTYFMFRCDRVVYKASVRDANIFSDKDNVSSKVKLTPRELLIGRITIYGGGALFIIGGISFIISFFKKLL